MNVLEAPTSSITEETSHHLIDPSVHTELPGILNWAVEGYNHISHHDQKESDTK